MKNNSKYHPICNRDEIASLWGTTRQNIGMTYANKDNKQLQYEMLDLGTYCIKNNINGEMLKLLVEYGNEFSKRFNGWTAQEIKEFEEFRRFKLFQETK
ncbi:hypothetical protein [Brevundimonas sp. FT23028]|uniref:hypothetical protein n=1 Tax=Brevundimonas sp. FT23028 TaxID=3393748 RepID=UPI003B589E2A